MCIASYPVPMTIEAAPQEQRGWTPNDATFAARLALVRQKMAWNVKEAADACGLPAENWRRWERDGIEPKRLVTIAMAIATKSGCDYLWLVHGPNRGALPVTGGYPTAGRVLAVIGTSLHGHPKGQTDSSVHSRHLTRPVRQTRPTAVAIRRPSTVAAC